MHHVININRNLKFPLNPNATNTQITLIRGTGTVKLSYRAAMDEYDLFIHNNKLNPAHDDYDEDYRRTFDDPANYADNTFEDELTPTTVDLSNNPVIKTIRLENICLSAIRVDDTGNTGDLHVIIKQW